MAMLYYAFVLWASLLAHTVGPAAPNAPAVAMATQAVAPMAAPMPAPAGVPATTAPLPLARLTYNDPCQVFGSIYIEKSARYADLVVYKEKDRAWANVAVFLEDNALFADRIGRWHITDNRGLADFTVYYTNRANLADMRIFITDLEAEAGCVQ